MANGKTIFDTESVPLDLWIGKLFSEMTVAKTATKIIFVYSSLKNVSTLFLFTYDLRYIPSIYILKVQLRIPPRTYQSGRWLIIVGWLITGVATLVIGLLEILTESHKIYDNIHGIGYIIWGNIMYEHYKYAM